jgi:beta-mannosidase
VRHEYNLGDLQWELAGWTPFIWRQQRAIESGATHNAEVDAVPARVPGSVQGALLAAGIIPDWNVGLQEREAEWVENRHWVYTAHIPDEWLTARETVRLRALGLDYSGWVLVNGKTVGTFVGTFVPHIFDITQDLRERDNVLQIVLDTPPRWLGQIGYTSQMTEWKARFNYFWDWTSRLVQLGIWNDLLLEVTDGEELLALQVLADAPHGHARLCASGMISGNAGATVRITLRAATGVLHEEVVDRATFEAGVTWERLPVALWYPNGAGEQPLYTVRCTLLGYNGAVLDTRERRVGFHDIVWRSAEGAASEAPWICVVNGQPLFLQGVNWTPILPNFADVRDKDYRRLLVTYRDMGCNALRVWGGAFLEKAIFYDLCDDLGLLVWQEFPLSSSGLDNYPPTDPTAIEEMAEIARSYVERRRHHACLLLWSGGNELTNLDGTPVGLEHPMIARLAQVAHEYDPDHRFVPTSPSGPHFDAEASRFGQGVHEDVHGPWHIKGDIQTEWLRYWAENDGLFHSEVGASGASPVSIIREYSGGLPEVPGTHANPLWRRTSWWIEWPVFVEQMGREPSNLEEYVAWSQERQRAALQIAAQASKDRFPRCGGFLLWMGHDSFPCTANLSIIDFHGNLKPAGEALGRVFRGEDSA